LNKPETEVIVRNKRKSKTKGKLMIIASGARWLPSASSAERRLLLLLAMVLGPALVIGKRNLEVGEDLKAKGLVKS
jgi:hypothetical protein